MKRSAHVVWLWWCQPGTRCSVGGYIAASASAWRITGAPGAACSARSRASASSDGRALKLVHSSSIGSSESTQHRAPAAATGVLRT